MRVLLVEDEDLIRDLLMEVMTENGFEVIGASDAEDALRLATTMEPPRVIVSDVNLGSGMNGFAFMDAARRLWPSVPMLLMSGVAANFNGWRHNMTARFLPKPFPLSVFLRHVTDLAGIPDDLPP